MHRMSYSPSYDTFIFPTRLMVTFFGQEGSVVVYWVKVGPFEFDIVMCNLDGRALDKETNVA